LALLTQTRKSQILTARTLADHSIQEKKVPVDAAVL
jgi:hypothetical protein